MKKIIAILLVCAMLFSLCACGEKKKEKSTGEEVEKIEFLSEGIEIGEDTTPIDLASAYQKVTYVPQMFYGWYETSDEIAKKYPETGREFLDPELGDVIIGYLPSGFSAGPSAVFDDIGFCEDYHIIKLNYSCKEFSYTDFFAAYDVIGNKIIFTVIESYDFDPFTLDVNVKLTNTKIEYDFRFEGNTIFLSDGTNTASYKAKHHLGSLDTITHLEGYLSEDTPDVPTDDFYALECSRVGVNNVCAMIGNKAEIESDLSLPVRKQEHEPASVEIYSDGLFRIARKDAKTGKVVTNEFIMFICGRDGIVLVDGEKTYCYTKSYKQIAIKAMSAHLDPEQIAVLKEKDGYQLQTIVERRNSLYSDLEKALADQGVKANINRANGEIGIDSTVLFATGESTLSNEGKAFLKKFVTAYSSVVLSSIHKDFISKVMIEGHTDSTGSEEVNKPLSKARADAVLEYCTSAESGLTAAQIGTIKNLLGTFGYAAERPVLKADGTEDADASRRVGFRFIINIDTSEIA